jgi:mono/diheme cytochrome c family protein
MLPIAIAVFLAAAGAATKAAPQGPAEAGTRTAWDGVYTQAQAERGAASFAANCFRCHGSSGTDGEDGGPLTGDAFWQSFRESSVDYLFDFVRENMPDGAGGSLSTSTYVDVVAYLLSQNGFPQGPEELTPESTVGVQIIAETGPGELPGGTLARVVGCLTRGDGREWTVTRATAPERIPEAAIGDTDATRPLGTRTIPLMFVLTSLDRYEGHRMSVSGLLMGEGGFDGINVSIVNSVADTCE